MKRGTRKVPGGLKLLAGRRSEGKVEIILGMYFLFLLIVILTVEMQMYIFRTTSFLLEDALAASNLASAVIDVREYGLSHTLRIASPDDAYALYRMALKENLRLNDQWEHADHSLVSGPVTVQQYIVYNVEGRDVEIFTYNHNGRISTRREAGGAGRVRTPDGTLVSYTSVYSRIRFPVEGAFGVTVYADKEKTVDIVGALGATG